MLNNKILISDEEVIIKGFYIKMKIDDYFIELYYDAIKDYVSITGFLSSFDKNVRMLEDKLSSAKAMSPNERAKKLKILPGIPSFLSGHKSITFKTTEENYKDLAWMASRLNTDLSNLTRVLIYMSLPIDLMMQFPFLLYHYRQTEDSINYYLEQLNVEKMDLYNLYKDMIMAQKE
jgi:hypothetical protein